MTGLKALLQDCERALAAVGFSKGPGFLRDRIESAIVDNERGAKRLAVEVVTDEQVTLALKVILNHIEPGWENCKFVVETWLSAVQQDERKD